MVSFLFVELVAYAQCDMYGRPRNAYLHYQVVGSSSSSSSGGTLPSSSSSSSSGGDPFNCNGGNPTQAARDYITNNCPDVFTPVPPYETISLPTVQYPPYIKDIDAAKDVCGYTNCDAGIIQLRVCNFNSSILPTVCSNLTLAGCPDICHTAAHEFAHWVYCKKGGKPAPGNDPNTCRQRYIEIGAERHAYDTCISMPYKTDPACSITREYLECACYNFNKSNCQNDSTLTADQKAQVTTWCELPELPCDCATERGKRRCVAGGDPTEFEVCFFDIDKSAQNGGFDVCTWKKAKCDVGTCKDGQCI